MPSLLRRGLSLSSQPVRRRVNPERGEPPTGEPDAGDPPVRFGGRGNETNRFSLPLSFIPTVRVESSGTRDGTRRKHRDPRPVANSDGSQVPPDLGLPLVARRCCRFGALLLHELPHAGNVTG